MFLFISKIKYFLSSFQPAIIVCLLMMAAFVTMVTETDGKPANEYEDVEGVKPVYKEKLQDTPSLFDVISKRKPRPCCCAPFCPFPACSCCLACHG